MTRPLAECRVSVRNLKLESNELKGITTKQCTIVYLPQNRARRHVIPAVKYSRVADLQS